MWLTVNDYMKYIHTHTPKHTPTHKITYIARNTSSRLISQRKVCFWIIPHNVGFHWTYHVLQSLNCLKICIVSWTILIKSYLFTFDVLHVHLHEIELIRGKEWNARNLWTQKQSLIWSLISLYHSEIISHVFERHLYRV